VGVRAVGDAGRANFLTIYEAQKTLARLLVGVASILVILPTLVCDHSHNPFVIRTRNSCEIERLAVTIFADTTVRKWTFSSRLSTFVG
jgi:hypothetical protein